jgi:hypothetical protein
MFYPAANSEGRVDNASEGQEFSINWNEIEQSYADSSHTGLETGRWLLRCFSQLCTAYIRGRVEVLCLPLNTYHRYRHRNNLS